MAIVSGREGINATGKKISYASGDVCALCLADETHYRNEAKILAGRQKP